MSDKLYFFFGCGGEYALHPIYEEMVLRGHDCLELDIDDCKDPQSVLLQAKNKSVVLITSAHLFMGRDNFRSTNMNVSDEKYQSFLSALQIIELLHPVKCVYYPHDLVDGFTHYDRFWFSLFDVYLSPLPVSYCGRRFFDKIIDVGWIKKWRKLRKCQALSGKNVKFAHAIGGNDYFLQKGDVKFLYDTFKDIWALGVKVKPYNYNGGYTTVKMLEKNSISWFPPDTNIYDFIEYADVVITNGSTGVNIEAALSGRQVINLFSPDCPRKHQIACMSGLPNVMIMEVKEAERYILDVYEGIQTIARDEDVIAPFNMALAIECIL